MECAELAERLTDFLEGALEEIEQNAAIEHLATCPACESVLAQTREVLALTREHGRVSLSDDDRARLWSRVVGDKPAGAE